MADFTTAYNKTAIKEGGYANNPNDRGGETYKGIARKMWPGWGGWKFIEDIKARVGNTPAAINKEAAVNVTLQILVKAFYKENFWNTLLLDQVVHQRIANEMYDTGVNMGTGVAATYLQRSLNAANRNGRDYADVTVDGKMGPRTLATINNHKNPGIVFKLMNCLQGAKYIALAEANPSQEVFMYGWMDRVFED